MVKVKEDLTGRTFGKLKVLSQVEDYIDKSNKHYSFWKCECQCENKTIVYFRGQSLKQQKNLQCKQCISKERRKRNNYDLSGEYGIGILSNTQEQFFFDLEDYDLIKDYTWFKDKKGYVVAKAPQEEKVNQYKLHKLITGYPQTDHINRNPLDCRKQNLRLTNDKLNHQNMSQRKNSNYAFIGVIFSKSHNKWNAIITKNYKTYSLGYFDNEEEAIPIRLQAEYDLFELNHAPQRELFEQYGIPNQELHQKLIDKGLVKE